ncbi:MAG: alpha/beta hydrolase [Actinomycetota bacterium]|nr:alpha/beta hydrolase [Actinomycetota bacterium]
MTDTTRPDTTQPDVAPPDATTADARPDWLDHGRWPAPIRSIGMGEHRVAYSDRGGDGPTLLLVHVGTWSIVWRDVVDRLAADFRVVTLDAPGNGLSTGPARVTIADAARAVDAVVRHLGLDDLTLVFHDLGGPATLEAAAGWPERVRGLAAVNTFGWRPEGPAFRGMLAVMGSAVVRESDAWTGWLVRATSGRFGVGRHLDRDGRRTFRRGMPRRGRRAFHHYLRSARRHDFTTIEATVADLGHLPLLTVFGSRNDPLGFQPRWAERFDDVTAVEVPGGNHFPMCDDPVLVADAITTWHRRAVR